MWVRRIANKKAQRKRTPCARDNAKLVACRLLQKYRLALQTKPRDRYKIRKVYDDCYRSQWLVCKQLNARGVPRMTPWPRLLMLRTQCRNWRYFSCSCCHCQVLTSWLSWRITALREWSAETAGVSPDFAFALFFLFLFYVQRARWLREQPVAVYSWYPKAPCICWRVCSALIAPIFQALYTVVPFHKNVLPCSMVGNN